MEKKEKKDARAEQLRGKWCCGCERAMRPHREARDSWSDMDDGYGDGKKESVKWRTLCAHRWGRLASALSAC